MVKLTYYYDPTYDGGGNELTAAREETYDVTFNEFLETLCTNYTEDRSDPNYYSSGSCEQLRMV